MARTEITGFQKFIVLNPNILRSRKFPNFLKVSSHFGKNPTIHAFKCNENIAFEKNILRFRCLFWWKYVKALPNSVQLRAFQTYHCNTVKWEKSAKFQIGNVILGGRGKIASSKPLLVWVVAYKYMPSTNRHEKNEMRTFYISIASNIDCEKRNTFSGPQTEGEKVFVWFSKQCRVPMGCV